jgi:hypothetical protein
VIANILSCQGADAFLEPNDPAIDDVERSPTMQNGVMPVLRKT